MEWGWFEDDLSEDAHELTVVSLYKLLANTDGSHGLVEFTWYHILYFSVYISPDKMAPVISKI